MNMNHVLRETVEKRSPEEDERRYQYLRGSAAFRPPSLYLAKILSY